jgi:type IV pilus assembly protein PilN
MVRVNLLPDKKAARGRAAVSAGEPGQLWVLALVGVLVLEIVTLLFVENAKRNELQGIVQENQKTQGQIDSIKRQIANHGEIKAALKELREREEAIQKLQAARTGPTATLLELSHVLTPGRGPTADRDKIEQLKRDNPTAVLNPNWDPRRLWLTQYTENERTVKIAGLAKDGEDVSEFERRLNLSDYFYEVKLLPAAKLVDSQSHQELVRFELSAKVRY